MQLAVLSALGREESTTITLRELEGRGAAHVIASRTLFYSAPSDRARGEAAAPELPAGWRLERRVGPRGGCADWRWMIGKLDPTCDAIVLEDDVQPCVNAIPAMVRQEVPADCGAVTFYGGGLTNGLYVGHESGVHVLPAPHFCGSQALRLPAWLIGRIQAGQFDPPPWRHCQDVWLGRMIHALGLKMAIVCPSLVQHVGEDSIVGPGAELQGTRAPAHNFPGQDFDALAPWPTVIEPGTWTPRPRVTWCTLHEMHHPVGITCPRREG